ncbi:TIGR04255 family protein [Oscillatoria salina]|uniref:TIGR04255 family protein n=1 Tax=Oscillatoria salina TaxID=331517 RepID=UPI0013BB3201|nr:TIGR04255 family protein [Oscillatoria salina]MBZ8181379.1 TIGR04255 family protein [Oscillatoria salina IIICB1]NET88320.1 TIGR04255 family protein [Kamptonema sp. SIO1D9]
MTEFEIFSNPPIIESIIDIRVNLTKDTALSDFVKIHENIISEFPERRITMNLTGNFAINLEKFKIDNLDVLDVTKDLVTEKIEETEQNNIPEYLNFSSANKQDGFLFISNDKKRFLEVGLNGFTFSRIAPYTNWSDFYSEAFELWNQYIHITKSGEITRLGLRYINRIKIPFEPPVNLGDYLRIIPEIPNDVSVVLSEYFMKLVLFDTNYPKSQAILTQAVEEGNEKDIIPLILDIDVFQKKKTNLVDTSKIKKIFQEELREFRNKVFFGSITERTKELFR